MAMLPSTSSTNGKLLFGLAGLGLVLASTTAGTFTVPGIGTAVGFTTAAGIVLLAYLFLWS